MGLNYCYSKGTGGSFIPGFISATHPNLMPRLKIVELSSAALYFFRHGLHDTDPSSDFSGSVSSLELLVILQLHDHVVQQQVCLPHASTFLVLPPCLYSLPGTLHLLLAFLVSSTFSFSHLLLFYLPPCLSLVSTCHPDCSFSSFPHPSVSSSFFTVTAFLTETIR